MVPATFAAAMGLGAVGCSEAVAGSATRIQNQRQRLGSHIPFQLAAESIRSDKQLVLAAVTYDGFALEYASDTLKSDKEVVMAAVIHHGTALQYAAEAFKSDKEVVLAAVRRHGSAMLFAHDTLKSDKEVVLAAVHRHGLAMQYAHDTLKSDKEVVLAEEAKDLKHGIKEALHVADSSVPRLTTAVDHEVERLWRELRQLRAQNAAELQRVETSGAEALQRAQEVERQVEAMHQEQLAGHTSLKDAYSHAMLTIQEHSAEVRLQVTRQKEELAQDLHALHESRLKSTESEAGDVKQAQHVANSAHKLVDEIALRLQDLEQQTHKQVAESAIVQLRLQEFERTHTQQHADHSSNHVTKPVEEMLLQVQNLEQQLHRQAAEVDMLQPRLHELEHAVQQQHQSADAVAEQMQKGEHLMELFQSSLDELRLASTTKCVPTEQQISSVDLQEFTNRLLVLDTMTEHMSKVQRIIAAQSDDIQTLDDRISSVAEATDDWYYTKRYAKR